MGHLPQIQHAAKCSKGRALTVTCFLYLKIPQQAWNGAERSTLLSRQTKSQPPNTMQGMLSAHLLAGGAAGWLCARDGLPTVPWKTSRG